MNTLASPFNNPCTGKNTRGSSQRHEKGAQGDTGTIPKNKYLKFMQKKNTNVAIGKRIVVNQKIKKIK